MTEKNSLRDMTPANLRSLYDLRDDDIARIRALAPVLGNRLEEFVGRFYEWLEGRPEHDEFFTDPTMVARVKARQVDYWRNFFDARIDRAYVDRLRVLGEVHAQIGLSLEAYFSGVSFFLTTFSTAIVDPKSEVASPEKSIVAATKLVQMDTAIVVSTFSERTRQIINEQNQALMQLSTPVSMLWDDILMLPIVGIVEFEASSGYNGRDVVENRRDGGTLDDHRHKWCQRYRHRRGQSLYKNDQGHKSDGLQMCCFRNFASDRPNNRFIGHRPGGH